MKKYILMLVAFGFSIASFAHSPNASATMLVEKENNTWVLQISASLTAFQQEIKTHFAETPYKTPEEFQQMVLEHVKKNLEISFNDDRQITFGQGVVKLGHETKVVFEVFGIPSEIQTATVKNTAFADIYKSRSSLLLFKEGFTKQQFVLNDANAHTLHLKVSGDTFVQTTQNTASFSENGFFLAAFVLTMLALALVVNLKPIRVIES